MMIKMIAIVNIMWTMMIKLGVDSSLMMVIKSGVGVAAYDHFYDHHHHHVDDDD